MNLFSDEAARIRRAYRNNYDDDDVITSKKDANIVVKNAFAAIRLIDEILTGLFKELKEANNVYYNNINYYKKFGGIYPDRRYISDLQDLIGELKEIKSSIYSNIDDIKSKKTWEYKVSFKKALDSIFE